MRQEQKDVRVQNEGTIFLIHPLTDEARGWIEDNVDPEAMWFGSGLVVEHRYVGDLLEGMLADGLTVEGD